MPTNPRRSILGCCARAASGHATAAPPSSDMNSRRLTSNMGLPPLGSAPPIATTSRRWTRVGRLRHCLAHSLDHLVGATEQRKRDGEAKRLRGLEIDDQLDFR